MPALTTVSDARTRRAVPPLRGLRARGTALACALAALAAAPARGEDSLRLAVSRAPISLPIYVAQQHGYFKDEGLDVSVDDCIGGSRCLGRVLDGKDDVGTSAEMPVVRHGFEHGDLAIIGTMTASTDNLKLIVRRGGGVTRAEQLEGRKVGMIRATAGHYLVETHLLNVGVDPRKVTLVSLEPEQLVPALRDGRVDAISAFEPYGYEALHATGGVEPVGLRLPLSGGYIETYNLVAARGLFGARDASLVKLLRAIERAEQQIHADPADAQSVLKARLGLDQHFVDWVWNGLAFRLSLDQSLLTTMESEARWAQREGHVKGAARPNVLTLVYPGPLKAVKPSAVGTGN